MSEHYPRRLQRLATELTMAVTYMRGYLSHQGVIGKNHPLVAKLDAAQRAFERALVEWDKRRDKNRREHT